MAELEHSFSLDNIKSILKSMAEHFGPECEVVLHDFSQGYENSVVAIENGLVTGRKVGSSITTSGLETLSSESDQLGDGLYNYITTGPDGRIIRSSTALLRDGEGRIFGSLCINQDITQLCQAEKVLHGLTRYGSERDMNELFVQNVDELLDHYMLQCTHLIGRAPGDMNKEELARSLDFLESKGVFRIKKAGDRVCETFKITKYQLYHHLDIIRSKGCGEDDEAEKAAE